MVEECGQCVYLSGVVFVYPVHSKPEKTKPNFASRYYFARLMMQPFARIACTSVTSRSMHCFRHSRLLFCHFVDF